MRRAVLALVGLLLLAGPADARERHFRDLPASTQEALAAVAHDYLDLEREFLWRPRKAFQAALADLKESEGIDALVDLPFLREIVYQGRHFRRRFSDRGWQREKAITDFEVDGPYRSLVSESRRFSYVVPRSYPKERALATLPRTRIEPYPLLLSIHELQDTRDERGRAKRFPGAACLQRRFPKDEFEDLYEGWLMLAPVAARAKFLEEGAIRHRVLTQVLSDLWRRYHVDFDRIVVDGAAPAAALAAAFPHVFAGVVLRPGDEMTLEAETVRNFATVPTYVVDDAKLGRQLEAAGHPNVTVGAAQDLPAWLNERRRTIPTTFSWSMLRPDHAYANWMVVTGPDWTAPRIQMTVDVLDTEDDPNTIRLDAVGIHHVRMFLSDQIVDLDRPVRLVVNGEARDLGTIERDFGRLFEKDPEVRRNMNFGWLFTAVLEDVQVSGEPPSPVPEPPPAEASPGLTPRQRLAAQKTWLQGRPDLIEEHLGPAGDAVTAVHLLPFALRDLWWRPVGGVGLRVRVERALEGLEGALADQLRWILAGGGGDPYPTFPAAADDPWPILTALVQERLMRETTGARFLPEESPVRRRKLPDAPAEEQDFYERWCGWFYDEMMRVAYEGEDPRDLPESIREADQEQAALAEDVRVRNGWLAVLVGVLFVGGAFLLGRRTRRA